MKILSKERNNIGEVSFVDHLFWHRLVRICAVLWKAISTFKSSNTWNNLNSCFHATRSNTAVTWISSWASSTLLHTDITEQHYPCKTAVHRNSYRIQTQQLHFDAIKSSQQKISTDLKYTSLLLGISNDTHLGRNPTIHQNMVSPSVKANAHTIELIIHSILAITFYLMQFQVSPRWRIRSSQNERG